MNKLGRITITFLLALTGLGVQAKIITYPVPTGIYYARHNDDYTVKVRQVGKKEWVDLYEYNVKVDMDEVRCHNGSIRFLRKGGSSCAKEQWRDPFGSSASFG